MMASTGRLYACDVSERRLDNLGLRLARSGASNVQTMRIESEHDKRLDKFIGKADRVLVDAPCSGPARSKRNPDLKWRQSPASVKELVEKQKSILCGVAPGAAGRADWSTRRAACLPKKTNGSLTHFSKPTQSGVLCPRRCVARRRARSRFAQLLPHRDECDGFFAAVFERQDR